MKTITNNTPLFDIDIREALKKHLMAKSLVPKRLIDELSVHNGNAKADLVALYEYAHCFEIKSDKDTLSRLSRQVSYYDFTFKKNTLVTTEKFVKKAEGLIPEYWGIWLAKVGNDGDVKIHCCRTARVNKNWHPEKALLTLWKSELFKLDSQVSSCSPPKNSSRAELANKIVKESSKKVIQKGFFETLTERFESELQPLKITMRCQS
jgi:hypothetical protein